jgi:hypothetical protein
MMWFLAYFPYFEKIKGGLWDHLAVSPQCLKAGTAEPEETVITRQQLRKNVPAEINTHTATEELLNAEFSVRSMFYQISNMQWKESRRLVFSSECLVFIIWLCTVCESPMVMQFHHQITWDGDETAVDQRSRPALSNRPNWVRTFPSLHPIGNRSSFQNDVFRKRLDNVQNNSQVQPLFLR